MRITCNRIGGFNVHGVALRHGENEVDAKAWKKAASQCIPAWLKAVTTGDAPDIVLHDSSRSGRTQPKPERDKISLIEACDDFNELDAMAAGELRTDVLEAIDRRLETLLSQKGT